MKFSEFKLDEADLSRRGLLKGLSSIASSTTLPQSVVAKTLGNLNPNATSTLGEVIEIFNKDNPKDKYGALLNIQFMGEIFSGEEHPYYILGFPKEWRDLQRRLIELGFKGHPNSDKVYDILSKNNTLDFGQVLNKVKVILGYEPTMLKAYNLLIKRGFDPSLKNFFTPDMKDALEGIMKITDYDYDDEDDYSDDDYDSDNDNDLNLDKKDEKPWSYGGKATGQFVEPMTAKATPKSITKV